MADHCGICDTRRPLGGTNMLVLGGDWIEFCPECGVTEYVTNAETGETVTLAELFRRLGGTPTPPNPETIAYRQEAERRHQEYLQQREAYYAELRKKEEAAKAARRAKLRGGIGNGMREPLIPSMFFGGKD